jgi:hypothetical protein
MSETMTVRRPGVVTFVGVVLYIKAAIAVVVAIALFFNRDNADFMSVTGRDSDWLTGTAVGEIIMAVLLFLVAAAIMSGAKWARLAVAIVLGIRMAVAVYWMIVHFGGGLQWNALLTVGIGIFVLWALYGNDASERYFEGHP